MTEPPDDESDPDPDEPRSAVRVATEGESWLGPSDRELEPGSPSLESVAFVLLGAGATLALFAQLLI